MAPPSGPAATGSGQQKPKIPKKLRVAKKKRKTRGASVSKKRKQREEKEEKEQEQEEQTMKIPHEKTVTVASEHESMANARPKRQRTHGTDQNGNDKELTKNATPRSIFRPTTSLKHNHKVLVWTSDLDYVPIKDEEAMCNHVFLGKSMEWGMLKDQTLERIAFLSEKCQRHNMTILQASSLRRQYMTKANKFPNAHERLGLGKETNIRNSAQLFEDCVADFLTKNKVPFLTETVQRQIQPKGMSTPDFLLKETIHLQWKDSKAVTKLNWVECKMFYGASTIPLDNKSAVGKVLPTAQKYVKLFGPGAICFLYGCGDQLAAQLRDLGVVAVDARVVDLVKLHDHDRIWCSDPRGRLLP